MSDALERITAMAEVMREYGRRVDKAKDELAQAQADYNRIELDDLPDLMRELKLKRIELEDGFEVAVEEDVKCGITEARRDDAHDWLRANSFGGLIKTQVTQDFERGENELAQKVANEISDLTGRPALVKESVHAGTLKSFVKEQRAKGANLPLDLFGIHPFNRAKLTPPKKKKAGSKG